MKNYLHNENENTTYQNLWNVAKAVLTGVNGGSSQINSLTFQLMTHEKEKTKSQTKALKCSIRTGRTKSNKPLFTCCNSSGKRQKRKVLAFPVLNFPQGAVLREGQGTKW